MIICRFTDAKPELALSRFSWGTPRHNPIRFYFSEICRFTDAKPELALSRFSWGTPRHNSIRFYFLENIFFFVEEFIHLHQKHE